MFEEGRVLSFSTVLAGEQLLQNMTCVSRSLQCRGRDLLP